MRLKFRTSFILLTLLTLLVACNGSKSHSVNSLGEGQVSVYAVYTHAEMQTLLASVAGGDQVLAMLGNNDYYVSDDTATVNAMIAQAGLPTDVRCGWIERRDMMPELVFFRADPLFAEKAAILAVTPVDTADVNVSFALTDASAWQKVTEENVGRRLAITANGHLVNAPLVSCPIDGGALSLLLPKNRLDAVFPGLKQ